MTTAPAEKQKDRLTIRMASAPATNGPDGRRAFDHGCVPWPVERRSGMTARHLPTFLGIGSMRCATSWLHRVLSHHPEISTPTPKQPNFFDKQLLHKDLSWYRGRFIDEAVDDPAAIRGEISTGYCKLGRRSVQLVRDLLGDVPIIFSIREPIDRTWSQLKYELGRGRTPQDAPAPLLFARACSRRMERYNDFGRTLEIWSSVFGPDRVHVALYDDLQDDPAAYLRSILEHIGADPDWRPPTNILSERVLSTKPCPMPPAMQWEIARQVRPGMERLNAVLDGRLAGWIEKHEALETPPAASRFVHRAASSMVRAGSTSVYDAHQAIRALRRLHRGRSMIAEAAACRSALRNDVLARTSHVMMRPPERRRAA